MRKIMVVNNVTLDGVMQAPGRVDEDLRGGFKHGGWAMPYNDEVKSKVMGEGMSKGGAMLFGRRTYEDFYKTWHGRTDNPFSSVLDNGKKYVASTTLKEPLVWQNSTLLSGDAVDAVAKLKKEKGDDLIIMGSRELIRSLMKRDLIDQFMLLIHPLVLGTGRQLFSDDGAFAKFTLAQSVPTTKGVIIATYKRADPATKST
jgi:dihydrofolate reductase